jgi:hypothetical protein
MRKIGLLIAGVVVCLGFGVAVVGCGSSAPAGNDKTSNEKMAGDKMQGDKKDKM